MTQNFHYENFSITGKQSCLFFFLFFFAVLHTRSPEHFADKVFSPSLIRNLSTEWDLPKFMFEIPVEFPDR